MNILPQSIDKPLRAEVELKAVQYEAFNSSFCGDMRGAK
jgi:hypothetical protein